MSYQPDDKTNAAEGGEESARAREDRMDREAQEAFDDALLEPYPEDELDDEEVDENYPFGPDE